MTEPRPAVQLAAFAGNEFSLWLPSGFGGTVYVVSAADALIGQRMPFMVGRWRLYGEVTEASLQGTGIRVRIKLVDDPELAERLNR